MGQGTLPKVRDVSKDPPGGLGLVGGPSLRFEMGRGTLGVVQDGMVGPSHRTRTGQVPSRRSRTGRGSSWRSETSQGPSERSWTGRGTVGEVRDRSGEP